MVCPAVNAPLESCGGGGKKAELSLPLAEQPDVHLCECVLAILINNCWQSPAQQTLCLTGAAHCIADHHAVFKNH